MFIAELSSMSELSEFICRLILYQQQFLQNKKTKKI